MANRHSHKKLRAETRARMARTGESYQTARARVLARHRVKVAVDLVPFRFFGLPMALATTEDGIIHSVAVLRAAPTPSAPYRLPIFTWLLPRGVN